MKKYLFLTIILFTISANAQDTIFVADYGLLPNTRENAIPVINRVMTIAKEKQNVVVSFPEGRYDFWPHHCIERTYYESNNYDINPKRLAILIEGCKKLTIDGNHSTFIFHDRMQPFTIDSSSKITLKNLSIDWDIPLTSQGEVVDSDETGFCIKINTLESPYIIENDKLVFVGEGWKSAIWEVIEFQPDTRFVEPYTGDDQALGKGWRDYKAKELSNGFVKLYKKEGFKRNPEIGNVLVLRHSMRDHAGVFILSSNDIIVKNVKIFHTAGLGILSQYSTNLTFNDVKVVPNKAKGRFLSGHDDGFHFMGCRGLIKIEKCEWSGLMDDPINVHGTCVRIIEIISQTKLKCRFMHNMSEGITWGSKGEKVGFIENKSMLTIGTGELKSYNPINKSEFIVELETPMPQGLKKGAAIENLTWTPNVEIRNSVFGSCRARGLLLSTPGKIIVENNRFESSGTAILIAGDANYWYESGAVKDVTIKNNTFAYPCMSSMYQFSEAIISILPEIPKADPNNPFHRNISIEYNVFHPFDYPILYAKSVNGLTFNNNLLIRSKKLKPFHKRKAGITLDACKSVSIKNNMTKGEVLGKFIKYLNMETNEICLEIGEYFELQP